MAEQAEGQLGASSVMERLCAHAGASVVALYRKTISGDYSPVFWILPDGAASQVSIAPPFVTSASDLAAYLRARGAKPFQMDCETFADGMVRHGLDEFGVSSLMVAPLKAASGIQYYLAVGASARFDSAAQKAIVEAADRLSALFVREMLQARIRGCALFPSGAANPTETFAFAGLDTGGLRLIEQAVAGCSFHELVEQARSFLPQDVCGILVQDVNGRQLAAWPSGLVASRSRKGHGAFVGMPYLDLLEETLQPVAVPPDHDETGFGRLLLPLVGEGRLLGLASILGVDESLVHDAGKELAAFSFACVFLITRREAARTRVLGKQLNSVENERMRIALELHDETSQNLVALKVRLATAERALEHGLRHRTVGIVEDAMRISDEILDGVNRLSASLRSSELNYLGFRQAIEAAAGSRLGRAGISFGLVGNALEVSFNALQENMLLAGVDEALANCAKHSEASHVEISMEDDGSWFTIAVRDDGKGFDALSALSDQRSSGHGLKSMSDCAEAIGGDFWVGSSPGKGTTVRFSVHNRMLEEEDDA